MLHDGNLWKLCTTYYRDSMADLHGEGERLMTPIGNQLGKERDNFAGTDALSMACQPDVLEWLKLNIEADPILPVVAEGDRLANVSFFNATKALGYDLTVAYLDTPSGMLQARRAMRSRVTGAAQNASWVAGRETKCRTLAQQVVDLDWWINGADMQPNIIAKLRTAPAISAIRRAAHLD